LPLDSYEAKNAGDLAKNLSLVHTLLLACLFVKSMLKSPFGQTI